MDLPESWDDEPWPLEEPSVSFRPVNFSDTHDEAPQVADLADEALEYALEHGVSMGQALATLQQYEAFDALQRAIVSPMQRASGSALDRMDRVFGPEPAYDPLFTPNPLYARLISASEIEVNPTPRQAKITNISPA